MFLAILSRMIQRALWMTLVTSAAIAIAHTTHMSLRTAFPDQPVQSMVEILCYCCIGLPIGQNIAHIEDAVKRALGPKMDI